MAQMTQVSQVTDMWKYSLSLVTRSSIIVYLEMGYPDYPPSPPTWAERPDFVLNALVAKKEMPDRRTLHTMVE